MSTDNIPPPGEGWIYYGKGPLEVTGSKELVVANYKTYGDDVAAFVEGEWDYGGWFGTGAAYYALRAGSEIARLNGLEDGDPDKRKRDAAVDAFAAAMKARLDEKAAQGYTGWDGEYPAAKLKALVMLDAAAMMDGEQQEVDIANRCMMLWYRRADA